MPIPPPDDPPVPPFEPPDELPVPPLEPPVPVDPPVLLGEPEPLMPPLFVELPRSSSLCVPRSVRLPVELELPGLLLDPPVLLLSGLLPEAP